MRKEKLMKSGLADSKTNEAVEYIPWLLTKKQVLKEFNNMQKELDAVLHTASSSESIERQVNIIRSKQAMLISQ
jgi:hypothetical protein